MSYYAFIVTVCVGDCDRIDLDQDPLVLKPDSFLGLALGGDDLAEMQALPFFGGK